MGVTIVGPYDRFQKYCGQSFGGVLVGVLSTEHSAAIGRRALADHPFSQEQINEIKALLMKNGDYNNFIFKESGYPDDWRFEKSDIIEHLPDDLFDKIKIDVAQINTELIQKLIEDPKILYEIHPRQFENIVAEMLSRMGYEVTTTPISRDGGIDLFAAKNDLAGNFLYVVQCKRNNVENKVGVKVVRELYGVVNLENANGGIITTTSFFTKPAQVFQERIPHQISLKDFNDMVEWLKILKK